MGLNLDNLGLNNVRNLMLNEFENDIHEGKVYISSRLKEGSKDVYINLMREAIQRGDDGSLAKAILEKNCLNIKEPRRSQRGIIIVRVPYNAHEILAEGEFNRFYIRALCRKAILEDNELEAYRAKEVRNPRPESEALIGNTMEPQPLLDDLRTNIGEEPSLKMPGGPNSGISIRIKKGIR